VPAAPFTRIVPLISAYVVDVAFASTTMAPPPLPPVFPAVTPPDPCSHSHAHACAPCHKPRTSQRTRGEQRSSCCAVASCTGKHPLTPARTHIALTHPQLHRDHDHDHTSSTAPPHPTLHHTRAHSGPHTYIHMHTSWHLPSSLATQSSRKRPSLTRRRTRSIPGRRSSHHCSRFPFHTLHRRCCPRRRQK
jgi:hypothetical protein